MDLKRFILILIFFIPTSFIYANPNPNDNPGIAFIHGTKDHRDDADGIYWKTEFIDSVSQGLAKPENHYVVHCDFNHYMWHADAGNCVADQLLQFIDEKKISSLTIYTHSNGANVIRWILSNPTYDSRYMKLRKKITQVIALAPSSAGTPLADEVQSGGIFSASVGWLLGYLCDAIKQQRVGDMVVYNDELLLGSIGRPPLPIPFKVVAGTDVTASPFTSDSYCNGYMLNSGLKITKIYLDRCADGFLNCSSQLQAGDLWFYDKDKTENNTPLSHNQSRHNCFGLEKILISVLPKKGDAQ